MTDNELIAQFMGFKRSDISFTNWKGELNGQVHYTATLFVFQQSWDWLMPVVEKISQFVYETYKDNNGFKDVVIHDRAYPRTFGMIDNEGKWIVRINRMPLEEGNTLIDATYKAVVEFIKWYNSQTN